MDFFPVTLLDDTLLGQLSADFVSLSPVRFSFFRRLVSCILNLVVPRLLGLLGNLRLLGLLGDHLVLQCFDLRGQVFHCFCKQRGELGVV